MYPIPANAMRIRYLESTGTQYVDTGVAVSDPSTIAIEADEDVTQPLGFTHQMVVSGTWVSRYSPPEATGNLYIYYKDFNKRVVTSANETRKTARWCGSSGYYENGASLTSFVASVGSDSISGRNWLYGAVYDFNINGVDSRFSRSGKIYGLKIWVSGVLVRSYIPVRVGQTGYLYDRVSGQLFGNAGTGSFVLGPDTFQQGVVPTRMMAMGVRKRLPYDAEIEYLESTGTQYVDTLTPMDGNLRVVLDYVCLNTLVRPFGAADVRGTTKNQWYLVNEKNQAVSNCSLGSTTNANVNIGQSPVGVRATATIDGRTLSAYGGTATVSSWTLTPKTDDCTLGLFACHVIRTDGSNPWVLHASMQLYSCAIYDGSTLVRDFVPVRVGTVGYLFDRVSGQLFGNAGTGAFTIGPDKT